jgi:hypothetical protein
VKNKSIYIGNSQMAQIYLTDAKTGEFVLYDTDSPTGVVNLIDADTGEYFEWNLASPAGTLKVLDADTGQFVTLDYTNGTGVYTLIDENTGQYIDRDLSASCTVYLIDTNTGRLISVPFSAIGSSTYHLHFEGTNSVTATPGGTALNNLPANDFTISFSMKMNPSVGVETWAGGYIFHKSSLNDGDTGDWDIGISDNGNGHRWGFMEIYDSSFANSYYLDFPATGYDFDKLHDGQYHHFEVGYDASAKSAKVFVDGVQITDVFEAYNGTYETNGYVGNDAGGSIEISDTGSYPLFADMRWMAVYNNLQHSTNFTPPSLTECPAADANTVLRLALDEGTGTTLHDTSGNGNDFTANGQTWEAD